MARFRLARVLELRTQLRRLRRLEAQQIEGERDALDEGRERLRAARASALEEAARAVASGTVDGATFALAGAYESSLRERLDGLERRLAENQQLLLAKREQLGHERREERKLKRLAERHRTAAEVAAALAAERLLDELVLARHRRTGGEST